MDVNSFKIQPNDSMVTLEQWRKKWYDMEVGTVFDINEFTSHWYLATVAKTRTNPPIKFREDVELTKENQIVKSFNEKYPVREIFVQWRYYPCDETDKSLTRMVESTGGQLEPSTKKKFFGYP